MNLASVTLNDVLNSHLIRRCGWELPFLFLLLFISQISVYAQSQPPQSAPFITATAGKANVTLTWGAVAGATNYRILRSTNGGAFNGYTDSSSTTFVDTTQLSNGSTYAYCIYPQNYWGYGPISNTAAATVTLSAPSSNASPGKAKITVTWNAIAEADSYQISRSENGGGFYQVAVNLTSSTFVDTGVSNSRTYAYQVRAYNNAGESQPSAVTTAFLNLDAPAGLTLSRDSNGYVTFSWGAVSDADSYYVYKSPNGISGVGLGSVTGTSKVDTAPYSPETFYYVYAHNAAGDSPISYMISTLDGDDGQKCTSPVDKPLMSVNQWFGTPLFNEDAGEESYLPNTKRAVSKLRSGSGLSGLFRYST